MIILILLAFIFKLTFGSTPIPEVFLIIFLNIILLCSLASFFVKNPIYSLFFLILNYVIVGFIFILNNFAFLSLIFMLMYVGAISILLLFTLMLLNLKYIYYKTINKNVMNILIYFLFFLQIFFFIFMFNKYSIIYKENNYFFNWFLIFILKNDLNVMSIELYLKNSSLIFIVALLILMALLASVNIVNSLKTGKKQDSFFQLKNYNKLFSN